MKKTSRYDAIPKPESREYATRAPISPPLLWSGELAGYRTSRMSPASYVTSEMKTNIAQRKKKSPPSSFSFSRTGTFDASGSLFLPTPAPRSIGSRSTHDPNARRPFGAREEYRHGRGAGFSGNQRCDAAQARTATPTAMR